MVAVVAPEVYGLPRKISHQLIWWLSAKALLSACHWWLRQHKAGEIGLENLPIGKQEDGFSCGILVDNTHQHFVDPSISLAAPGEYVEAGPEIFNKACVRSLE
jgi:hypothetical protein